MKQNRHPFKPLLITCAVLNFVLPSVVFAVAGKFQFVNGEVQVLDAAGKARAVKKGDAIDEGETVASGANGFAQIRMEDGGFFAVRPDTEFKIDTFKYEGKEDGSEKGIFSLVKGSLRSVTGIVGKKHKENYKINTATATIGIRGSGADVGHNNQLGTGVRTLFGGHSLTSGGKTINTGPGQTALAPPGEPPRFVPNFPFNTSTTGGGSNNAGGDGGGDTGGGNQGNNNGGANNASGTASNDKVVIPVVDEDGNLNLTNLTQNGSSIGGSDGDGLADPTGIAGPVGSGGVTLALLNFGAYVDSDQGVGVVDNAEFFSYVDANGNLVGWKILESYIYNGETTDYKDVVKKGSAIVVQDGSDPINGVVWGRWGTGWESAYSESHNGGTPTIYTDTPLGGLAFITATHITTDAELAGYGSWPLTNGLLNAGGNITGYYSTNGNSFPTSINGFADVGLITGAHAVVNFTTAQISSFSVNGAGGVFGNWGAATSGASSIADFKTPFGIQLSGSCTNGSGVCAGMGTSISGKVVGTFSGTEAQGIISTVGVAAINGNTMDRVGGVVYLQRNAGAVP